ncbi:MAG: glycosyltransferase family 9 protein [Isosphaeraceae bacterium]
MDDLSQRLRRLEPRKICIIKPSSLGDVVHSLPILPALRQRFPSSRISWVVNRAFRSLLERHPDLDRVIAYDRGGAGISIRGVTATSRLCGNLLRDRYDLTIDLQGLLRSGLMTLATRAKVRVGMADAREGAGWSYTHTVDASRLGLHAVERVQRVIRALGIDDAEPSFVLPIGVQEERWSREILEGVPRPRLVLNLGARWYTKRWPPEHFAEVARRAAAEFGAGLVVVGSADDRPLALTLARKLGPLPLLDLTGTTTLIQLAALARESELFLSNDTGPLHLAAAAGAAVVGIYTCTDPRLTGPYGPRTSTVQSCVWCAPSFQKTCRRLECFAELTPDRVWPTVRGGLIQGLKTAPVVHSIAG